MYDIVSHLQGQQKRNLAEFLVQRMVLSPPQWSACRLPLDLKWKGVKFTQKNAKQLPTTYCGVYTFLVQPGIANHPCCSYLLYVGKTEGQNFRKRYSQYLRDKRAGDESRRPHITDMLQKWDGFLWFYYAQIDQRDLIGEVENALLTAYLPPTNKEFPAKVSMQIRRLFGT